MKRSTLVYLGFLATAPLSLVPAHAQTAWDTNSIAWFAPTTCTTGEPVTACPVTAYRIERAASSSGTFASVGTSQTLAFTHTGAAAGTNCYRVIAQSANGDSGPSNVACKTNTRPSGPPNPPTGVAFTTAVVWNVPYTPVFRYTNERINTNPVAMVPVGRRAQDKIPQTWRGYSMCRITVASQETVGGNQDMQNLVAPCV
jgi:hypothetical protein